MTTARARKKWSPPSGVDGRSADAAAVFDEEIEEEVALADGDVPRCGGLSPQDLGHFGASRITAGVQDAVFTVGSLPSEREGAVGQHVKTSAELDELFDTAGTVLDQDRRGLGQDQVVTGPQGVVEVILRRIAGTERRRDAPLSVPGVALHSRPLVTRTTSPSRLALMAVASPAMPLPTTRKSVCQTLTIGPLPTFERNVTFAKRL